MDREPLQRAAQSFHLSRVLSDIGVTETMIKRRRNTYLQSETFWTYGQNLQGSVFTCYHFGSQSEGSTTYGMGSDLDTLMCDNICHVIVDWSEWQLGRQNLLMIKDDTIPPRHCLLQQTRIDSPEPLTVLPAYDHAIYGNGKIVLKNTYLVSSLREASRRMGYQFIQHGPSGSMSEKFDFVFAFHCATLPDECRSLFRRPRPGPWPKDDTLRRASECGTFVLPVGYPDSVNTISEWRFSTSMIERMLMFDLNDIQLKTYITLKILRKTFLKPILGDRLSSFHCKTALLFTIENTPAYLWTEQRLLDCVLACLKTLLRFVCVKFCPHYVISSMNLFSGKVQPRECTKLSERLGHVIDSRLQCVVQVRLDNIGDRLNLLEGKQPIVPGRHATRYESHCTVASELAVHLAITIVQHVNACLIYCNNSHPAIVVRYLLSLIHQLHAMVPKNMLEIEVIKTYTCHFCSALASVMASLCIYSRTGFSHQVIGLFQLSMGIDLATSKLKFASACYCFGHYELARKILHDVETKWHDKIISLCVCSGIPETSPDFPFEERLSNADLIVSNVACCVRFTKSETCCVPEHLLYEMFRSKNDIHLRRPLADDYMDMACADALPFLYYLQYLTFKQVRLLEDKYRALDKLQDYIYSKENKAVADHTETALHLLGHCWELENRPDLALRNYRISLRGRPFNNAAMFHIARLLRR